MGGGLLGTADRPGQAGRGAAEGALAAGEAEGIEAAEGLFRIKDKGPLAGPLVGGGRPVRRKREQAGHFRTGCRPEKGAYGSGGARAWQRGGSYGCWCDVAS